MLSREVQSNQLGIHKNLEGIVNKHLAGNCLKPIAEHTRKAFDTFAQRYQGQPLIFDSGCGTARSSITLAKLQPNAFIVGIDKSEARLRKTQNRYKDDALESLDNLFIVRANYDDFLKIAVQEKLQLWQHKLLYPNPWPKSQHLQRRWHGSATFKLLLALGGEIELRSNWKTYVDEFAYALSISGHKSKTQQLCIDNDIFLSDFEEKYHKSQQSLWQLRCEL